MKDIQRLKELYNQYKEKKCTAAEVDLFFDLLGQSCFDESGLSSFNGTAQLQVSTSRGEYREFSLSDGSVVKLGQESTLIYSDVFKGNKRFVNLKGHAVFNIAPSEDYTFVIGSGPVTTKIEEGCLDIFVDEDGLEVRVSVLKGKALVALESSGHTRKWNVFQGRSIVVDSVNKMMRKKEQLQNIK